MTFFLFLTLAALIAATISWVNANATKQKLTESQVRAAGLAAELEGFKSQAQARDTKGKGRVEELEELRQKHKDLRRRAAEAEERADKLKQQDELRRQAEADAVGQVAQARHETREAALLVQRLKSELEAARGRRPAPAAVPVAAAAETGAVPGAVELEARPGTVEAASEPAPAPAAGPPAANGAFASGAAPGSRAEPRARPGEVLELEARLRAEQGRIAELDARARGEQRKALDSAREVDRARAKASTAEKLYVVQKGELELWKDRYRTLEQRLNKTLREVDILHRGVLALERRLPQVAVEEARAEAQAQAAEKARADAAAEAAAKAAEGAKAAAEAAQASPAPAQSAAEPGSELAGEAKSEPAGEPRSELAEEPGSGSAAALPESLALTASEARNAPDPGAPVIGTSGALQSPAIEHPASGFRPPAAAAPASPLPTAPLPRDVDAAAVPAASPERAEPPGLAQLDEPPAAAPNAPATAPAVVAAPPEH